MLGLPKATELNKPLPKTALYTKFQMSAAAKAKFDADVSRISIVGEISPRTVGIAAGEKIGSIFVLLVSLKHKSFLENTIAQISKLIDQNMLLILEHGEQRKLAIYHTKLIQTEWMPADDCGITLKGLDLDGVWENFVRSLEGGEWSEALSLEENIALHERQAKLEKEIARLEKLARAEKQPKKKFELVQEINRLRNT